MKKVETKGWSDFERIQIFLFRKYIKCKQIQLQFQTNLSDTKDSHQKCSRVQEVERKKVKNSNEWLEMVCDYKI